VTKKLAKNVDKKVLPKVNRLISRDLQNTNLKIPPNVKKSKQEKSFLKRRQRDQI
jgi:hypothetical protein